MRSIWAEPGLSGYFGSSRLTHAKTWEDFKLASQNWAYPLNLVYADVKGNVGWAASGRTPIRKNWDGLMPVPGDGRYEWQGFFGKDMLPSVLNPEGRLLRHRQRIQSPGRLSGRAAQGRFRMDRPFARQPHQGSPRRHPESQPLDSMKLQTDSTSSQARRLVALVKGVPGGVGINVDHAIKVLTSWDGNETVDSQAAAIYEVWANKHLGKAVVAKVTRRCPGTRWGGHLRHRHVLEK